MDQQRSLVYEVGTNHANGPAEPGNFTRPAPSLSNLGTAPRSYFGVSEYLCVSLESRPGRSPALFPQERHKPVFGFPAASRSSVLIGILGF